MRMDMDNHLFLRAVLRSLVCNRMSVLVRLSYVMSLVQRTACNYADCIYLKRPSSVSVLSLLLSFSHPPRSYSLLISTGALLAIATRSLVSSTRLAYRILGSFRHS